MVCTKHAPRRQQFHLAPAMYQPNSAISTLLWWIFVAVVVVGVVDLFKSDIKEYRHSFKTAYVMSAVSLLESRE